MASRIRGITVEIGGDTTGLEKALQSVNKSLRDTQSQLKDVERLLKLDPSNTELLSQKQKLLAQSISDTKQKLEALKTAQEQAKQQLDSGDLGKDKYDALQREIIETEQELEKLVKQAGEANTALNQINQTGKDLENIGNEVSGVGRSLTQNITVPIVAAGTAIVKTAGDFDQSMAQVKAVTQATGDDFAKLRDLAIDLGAKTAYSAVEVADAMTEMAKAGWDTNQIMDGMAGVLDAAAASGEGLASVATIVADAVSGFGLEASDAARVADILAHAANAGTIDISDLGESFKYVAPMAQSMGLSIEDVSTALTAMSMAGIKGSQAGTSLRRMLTNLAKPTKSVQEAIDALGISITNSDGSFKSLDEIVAVLRDSFSGLTDEEKAYYAATLAGANGQSGLLALLNLSEEEYAALSEEMKNCRGEAEKTATTMQDNLNSKFEQLGGALESLSIKLGDILLPKLKSLVEWMTKVVEKFTNAPKSTQELILKIAGIAAAIGPVLLIFGKLTTAVGQGMQAFAAIGKHISTFVTQAQLGVGAGGKLAAAIGGISAPVVAVTAVVALLAAAFKHLWDNNEEFRTKVTAIWEEVKAKFSEAAGKITDAINQLGFDFSGLGEAIEAAWDWLCNTLEPIVTGVIQNIGQSLEGTIDIVTGIVETIAGIIIGFKDGDWSTAIEGLKTIWDGIWEKLTAPVEAVITIIDGYLQDFGTSWEEVWTGAKDFFTGVWESISSFFTTTWDGIKSTFETTWGTLSSTVETVWNDIKSIVQLGILAVQEFFTAAFEILTLPFQFIWENCKETVTEAWDAIQQKVTTTMDSIQTTISSKWTAIKSVLTPIVQSIKTTVVNAWNTVESTVSTVLGNIYSSVSSTWETIKTTVSTAVENVKSTISTGFESAKTTITTIFDSIKSTISDTWEDAKSIVSNAIDYIKGLFDFEWSLPSIKLPHFTITGSFSLNPPSVPHFSVEWYAKAMKDGMILNNPTIFGMMNGHLLAGGEAGSETVVGTSSLLNMIQEAVNSAKKPIEFGDLVVNVTSYGTDATTIADEIGEALNRKLRMSGGW